VVGQAPESRRKLRVGERAGTLAQRRCRGIIQLFCNAFMRRSVARAGLHANLYSSKFQPRALQYIDQGRETLAEQAGGSAGSGNQGKLGRAGVNHPNLCGEGRRQAVPDSLQHRDLALATIQKTGEGRFGR
jgi:hypothetical protein